MSEQYVAQIEIRVSKLKTEMLNPTNPQPGRVREVAGATQSASGTGSTVAMAVREAVEAIDDAAADGAGGVALSHIVRAGQN